MKRIGWETQPPTESELAFRESCEGADARVAALRAIREAETPERFRGWSEGDLRAALERAEAESARLEELEDAAYAAYEAHCETRETYEEDHVDPIEEELERRRMAEWAPWKNVAESFAAIRPSADFAARSMERFVAEFSPSGYVMKYPALKAALLEAVERGVASVPTSWIPTRENDVVKHVGCQHEKTREVGQWAEGVPMLKCEACDGLMGSAVVVGVDWGTCAEPPKPTPAPAFRMEADGLHFACPTPGCGAQPPSDPVPEGAYYVDCGGCHERFKVIRPRQPEPVPTVLKSVEPIPHIHGAKMMGTCSCFAPPRGVRVEEGQRIDMCVQCGGVVPGRPYRDPSWMALARGMPEREPASECIPPALVHELATVPGGKRCIRCGASVPL